MAAAAEQIPFLKQLVDSDRQVRDRALTSLRAYLSGGRSFTELELLKLWQGLYFSVYHTPLARSKPLVTAITSLTRSLPPALFGPFGAAFWRTVAREHPMLDAHRIDKYLLLMRRFLGAQLAWMAARDWDREALAEFVRFMADRREGPLGLGGPDEAVGDGVRYHLLDVWVDEAEPVLEGPREQRERVVTELRRPLDGLAEGGRSKVMKERAAEALADERWEDMKAGDDEGGDGDE